MASVAGVSIGVSAWPVLGSGTDGVSVIAGSGSASRISVAVPKSCYPSIYCGRGDRRTKKGKRFNHSFGNSRPKNKKKGKGIPPPPLPPRPPKKDFYDGEKIEVEIDDVLD